MLRRAPKLLHHGHDDVFVVVGAPILKGPAPTPTALTPVPSPAPSPPPDTTTPPSTPAPTTVEVQRFDYLGIGGTSYSGAVVAATAIAGAAGYLFGMLVGFGPSWLWAAGFGFAANMTGRQIAARVCDYTCNLRGGTCPDACHRSASDATFDPLAFSYIEQSTVQQGET